ncbi:NAD-dependent malic enzyme [Agaribacterium haliotis]|uniref:NAD-dependent malic enzyme n=1 Tax=Agaribacterium haliotis TaxID=2013869 RepID=UPI000BB56CA5|nr:NAD-dependent malic enzyme [Agaribacterium haliotis]
MALSGSDILNNPRLNKGTAFTHTERDALGLTGLLPPFVSTMEQQVQRALGNVRRQKSDIDKYMYLSSLQKRNERLFFRLLIDHIHELMPLVYTPTVGQACEEFAANFRETAGFYVSIEDRGNIDDVLSHWPEKEVKLIVVTDGERILGLGDQGANGMGIPIGKLALYCACAGVDPAHCMPIMLDVGTENESYLNDALYLGLRRRRARGEEYDSFIEEFIQAVVKRFPQALLQFEDFATDNAVALLERYRRRLLCFNDDIQGTAGVAVAGLLASTRLTGLKLSEQKFLFLGAGSASTGIGDLLCRVLQREGLSEDQARERVYFVNRKGLVVDRDGVDYGPHLAPFSKAMPEMSFGQALDAIKPQVLIGASGTPGVFTQDIIEFMAEHNRQPVIFALSNPTSKAECSAEDAYQWSGGRAIFASGSPFGPVHINGEIKVPGQGNNAYIFPGLGLGALSGGITSISDDLLICAAQTLADSVTDNELAHGCLYPPLQDIRQVSQAIAVAVAERAAQLGAVRSPLVPDFAERLRVSLYDPRY